MWWFIFGILGAVVPSAHAGEKIGNGGGAWSCSLPSGGWKWLRQIDLYEGVTEYHLPMTPQSGDPVAQAEAAILKLSQVDDRLARDYSFALLNVRNHLTFVRAELELIDDALFRIRPYVTECAGGRIDYVQVANFKEDGQILVREDVWNHPDFSSAEKAALYLHEAVYADLRSKYGEENSTRARHLVALLMSDLNGTELGDEVKRVLNETPDPTAPAGMKFATVPAGTYTIGINYYGGSDPAVADPRFAVRRVSLAQPLEMTTTEITEHQYYRVSFETSGTRYSRRVNCPHNFVVTGTVPYEKGYCPNLPALFRLEAARNFANRLTEIDRDGYKYRLPTADEWEIAARAGATTIFATGDEPESTEDYAVLSTADLKRTQPQDVASLKPNAFGFYDMLGNLREIAMPPGGNGFEGQIRGCDFSEKAEIYLRGFSTCSEAYYRIYPETWGAIRLVREKR